MTTEATPVPVNERIYTLDAIRGFALLGIFIRRHRAVATLVCCVHNDAWRRRLAPMAIAGRMPLTNYLLQTAIATTLFYGWGFGLWGKVGLALAIAILFAVQVPLSRPVARPLRAGSDGISVGAAHLRQR